MSGERPPAQPGARRFGDGVYLLYVSYYLLLAFATSVPFLVNGTVDDSYYYLVVARNLAAGLGSTFDGTGELTNGYHPLWMALLVPIYALVENDEVALRIALFVSGLLALGMLAWIRSTLRRVSGEWAGNFALLLFAWPRFFGLTQNLLETALLLFLYAWLFAVLTRGRLGAGATYCRLRRVGVGLLLGLAMLARLDTVFLIFAVGLFALAIVGRGGDFWEGLGAEDRDAPTAPVSLRARLLGLWPLLAAAVPVLPYLIWNLATFGHLQPVSGEMKTTFPRPGFHPGPLREFPEYALLAAVAAIVVLWALRGWASPRGRDSRAGSTRVERAFGVFALAALLHLAYTLVFMIWAVDRWHFALLVFLALIVLPVFAERILAWLGDLPLVARVLGRRAGPGSGGRRLAALAGVVGLLGAVAVQAYSLRLREGRFQADTYRLSLWVRDNLPADAVLASTDCGVLGYFSGRSTVNLDGLINSFDYLERLRSGDVETYLREKRVGYILDQNAFHRPDVIAGEYESRIYRIAYRPEGRVTAEIELRREDEVHRLDVRSRMTLGSAERVPNAVILYRYQPRS